jgi:hypothetical protein
MLLGREQLEKCRKMILDIANEQIAYHKAAAKKNRTIYRKLEKFGDASYWVSLAAILLRVLLFFTHARYPKGNFHDVEKTLNIFCLILPALAAVAHAFAEQGGFHRLESRSEAMAEDLSLVKKQLEMIPEDAYLPIRATAEKMAYLMIAEVSDWRLFVKSKELKNH